MTLKRSLWIIITPSYEQKCLWCRHCPALPLFHISRNWMPEFLQMWQFAWLRWETTVVEPEKPLNLPKVGVAKHKVGGANLKVELPHQLYRKLRPCCWPARWQTPEQSPPRPRFSSRLHCPTTRQNDRAWAVLRPVPAIPAVRAAPRTGTGPAQDATGERPREQWTECFPAHHAACISPPPRRTRSMSSPLPPAPQQHNDKCMRRSACLHALQRRAHRSDVIFGPHRPHTKPCADCEMSSALLHFARCSGTSAGRLWRHYAPRRPYQPWE